MTTNNFANFASTQANRLALTSMSGIFIYIKLEPLLAQWVMNEQGGNPIHFGRKSTEHNILETFLMRLPYGTTPNLPGENKVPIELPHLKHKDVRVYNYLPRKAQNALKRCIRNRFVIDLWQDLHQFGYIGKRKQDLIYAWMESHGITATETNFFALQKIYQRKREAYRKQKFKENLPDFGH